MHAREGGIAHRNIGDRMAQLDSSVNEVGICRIVLDVGRRDAHTVLDEIDRVRKLGREEVAEPVDLGPLLPQEALRCQ